MAKVKLRIPRDISSIGQLGVAIEMSGDVGEQKALEVSLEVFWNGEARAAESQTLSLGVGQIPCAVYYPELLDPEGKDRETLQTSVNLRTTTIERLRKAVHWTPGLRMYHVVQAAVERELDRIETIRGAPFPDLPADN